MGPVAPGLDHGLPAMLLMMGHGFRAGCSRLSSWLRCGIRLAHNGRADANLPRAGDGRPNPSDVLFYVETHSHWSCSPP
jgi:hypothetical protein